MTWIALTNAADGRFRVAKGTAETSLSRGTLIAETRSAIGTDGETLLSLQAPFRSSFRLRALPNGAFAVVRSSGQQSDTSSIEWPDQEPPNVIRFSYAWDTDLNWARIALQDNLGRTVVFKETKCEGSFDLALLHSAAGRLSDNMISCAISDDIEPIGPLPTLHAETPILMPEGLRPAHSLKRGDLVVTADGQSVPVLHRIQRTMPNMGSWRAVRVRAPYLGLESDLIAAPHQMVVMRGVEVEYLFGKEAVLVPVSHLTTGNIADYDRSKNLIDYVQLVLPRHAVLNTAGAQVDSLFIGRCRRKQDLLPHSVFRDVDRNSLPEHAGLGYPILRPYEAISLFEKRAA